MQGRGSCTGKGNNRYMVRRLGNIVRENKRYIWIGIALMLLGVLVGYVNADAIKQLAKQMMESIQRIARNIGK